MTASMGRVGGAPSELHEYRVEVLGTLATLAGYSAAVGGLMRGERPDVVQLREVDGSIFIGDAKASETPGNADTFERLSRYAEFLGDWIDAGGRGTFALAVTDLDGYGWLRTLRDVTLTVYGGGSMPGRVDLIEAGTAVAWRSFIGPIT